MAAIFVARRARSHPSLAHGAFLHTVGEPADIGWRPRRLVATVDRFHAVPINLWERATPATDMENHQPLRRNRATPGTRVLRNGRVSLPGQAYLVTTLTRHRQPLFADFGIGCAAARCFDDRQLLGDASMLAWVLMPDHAHWLLQLGERDALGTVVNRLKSASARVANRALCRTGPLWAPAFHDHALRADEELRRSARYVIANPVRAGLTERIGDYPFWNAVWV